MTSGYSLHLSCVTCNRIHASSDAASNGHTIGGELPNSEGCWDETEEKIEGSYGNLVTGSYYSSYGRTHTYKVKLASTLFPKDCINRPNLPFMLPFRPCRSNGLLVTYLGTKSRVAVPTLYSRECFPRTVNAQIQAD